MKRCWHWVWLMIPIAGIAGYVASLEGCSRRECREYEWWR